MRFLFIADFIIEHKVLPNPRASGFTILDKDFDLSSQLGAPLVTRHSASSPKLELVNFGHTSGDRNIIQSYGNAYYLISRKDNDQVAIVGRAEYRGNVDTENIKPWQPSAEDGKTSDIARSDLAEIEDLLVRSGKKVSSLIRIPDSDNFKAVKAAGEYLSPEGYNVRYRASIILPDEQSDEIIRHYALVVEKNDRAYVVDISAARFSKQGIENPLYLTDPAWRVQYISTFPNHLMLIRDLDNIDSLEKFSKAAQHRKALISRIADPDWKILNKPSWTVLKASAVTEAIETDLIIDIGETRTQRAYLDLNSPGTRTSMSLERIGEWQSIQNDQDFIAALYGAPSTVFGGIRTLLSGKNIKSKTAMINRYRNFYEKNPTTDYSIHATFNDGTTDVIVFKPTPAGDAFAVTRVSPLKQWLTENKYQITFIRFIDDPGTIPDYLDAAEAPQHIGRSNFFSEITNRYSLIRFDQNEILSLESTIAQTRAELARYSGSYLGNDLQTERSILEQYRAEQPQNQMKIRVQEIRINEIYKCQLLRGLLGRFEDLRIRIRGGVPANTRLEVYTGKRMIGEKSNLEIEKLHNIFLEQSKVTKFDRTANRYIAVPGFSVISIPNLKLLFGQVELKTILSGYLRLYKEIYDLSIAYSVHGRLTDGKKIVINSHIGIEMTERLSRYSDLHYDDHVYALIDENEFDFQNPRAYGLSIILNFHKKDEILHLDTVVEHPFIQLRNEDDFVDYANRRGAEWNLQTLEEYKVEGVGRFLSYQTAKKSLEKSDAKYFSLQVRNPRTENIASALGMKEMNDLEVYGLDVSLKADQDAQWSLLRSIFGTITPKIRKKSGTKGGPAVATAEDVIRAEIPVSSEIPVPAPAGSLNRQWRREDVSLDLEKPGDPGTRFEGIYSVSAAGSSKDPEVWTNYIKDGEDVFQVRWDADAQTWRIVDPLEPGTFGNAPPVRLDHTRRWVTHTDIPEIESGRTSIAGRVGHLVDLAEPESREMRVIVESGRKRAVNMIEGALKVLDRSKADDADVNDAMDIFFGNHEQLAKETYVGTLKQIRDFLKELDVIDDVSYRGGYFDKKDTVMRTITGAALGKWKEGPPPISVSVDKLADISLDIRFTFREYQNEVAGLLIHEGYHAVSVAAHDSANAKISAGVLDISPIIRLRDLQWFGDDKTIMRTHGISKEYLAERREKSYLRSIQNPDNLAYLTALLSNVHDRNPLYGKFITKYDRWIMNQDSALEWKNKGYDEGGPLRLKTRTSISSLIHADTQPLVLNGFLYRTSSSKISVEFEVLSSGSSTLEKISSGNRKFSDFIDTWDGSKTTSQKNDMWSGTWGSEHFLNKDFSIIEITGENSVVNVIRIDLRNIYDGQPLIISGGELRGSTLALAFAGEGLTVYLYAFHAGYRTADPNWIPSQHGVAGIYNAHLAMGGEPIAGWTISEAGVIVDEGGNKLGYQALGEILGKYRQGLVAYSGRLPDSTRGDVTAATTVEWIDYSAAGTGSAPGRGHAYALAVNDNGEGKIRFLAKAAPSPQPAGGRKPEQPKP